MLTFNQDRKDDLIMKLERHAQADAFRRGVYFENGKGCAVGCTLVDYGVNPEKHAEYEPLFGIPEVIALLEDSIFEGLPIDKAKKWPLRFANAVPVKTDLSGVWPKFAIALMIDPDHGVINYAQTEDQGSVIRRCADLYTKFPNVDKSEARLIRKDAAAAYAVDAAASGAAVGYTAVGYTAATAATADAVYAAYAADAAAAAYAYASSGAAKQNHHEWMADKLIEILENAA